MSMPEYEYVKNARTATEPIGTTAYMYGGLPVLYTQPIGQNLQISLFNIGLSRARSCLGQVIGLTTCRREAYGGFQPRSSRFALSPRHVERRKCNCLLSSIIASLSHCERPALFSARSSASRGFLSDSIGASCSSK